MTYVISDIHGNTKRLESILKQINLKSDDTLFILGDVIDRYPDGIRLLRRFMKMPNVKMLLGNHEYMMIDALKSQEEKTRPYNKWNYDPEIYRWYRNGGEVTHQYLKHIRKDLRQEVIDYIKSLPLNIDIEVNGTKYKLVHGSPVENYDIYWNKNSYSREEFAVWERWDPTAPVPEDCVMIFGHTPTQYFSDKWPMEIWHSSNAIGIDCGCGYFKGRLACLRLNDMKEFYSE